MMRNCDLCGNWAQWHVREPIYGPDPKDPSEKVIVGWRHVAFRCGAHKEEAIQIAQGEFHFAFMGAALAGINA